MDLPKCKICGERHRLGACSPVSSSVGRKIEPATVRRSEKSERAPDRDSVPVKNGMVEVASTTLEAKFDRVAYQREYMKAWRAKRNK